MFSQGRSCAENISKKVVVLILMFIKLGQCEFFVVHSEGWSCAENILNIEHFGTWLSGDNF